MGAAYQRHIPGAPEKRCTGCGEVKPSGCFYRHDQTRDGLASRCKACHGATAKRWKEQNPERWSAYNRDFQRANKDAVNAKSRRWRSSNPEAARDSLKRYRDAHPEAVKATALVRRSRIANAGGHATAQQIAARVEFFGARCSYCGGAYEALDHAIPVARGGTNWPANLRPSCNACNLKKSAKPFREWMNERRGNGDGRV